MLLEAQGISYRHQHNPWLFQDFSLAVKAGEIVGLVGPSGCGKSTLGRILAGYEQPHEGRVVIDGEPIVSSGYHAVQLVFQHPEKAVNSRWTMGRILKEGGEQDPDLLSSLGIEQQWLSRWPNELSGGELQRFCVARALGTNTRFLIADEMTTMLDAITQAQIWHAVLSFAKKRNMGVLVISHEWNLIQRICDRVIDFQNKNTMILTQG
ncbi:ABC transporter ATP-binding protein [Ammoniphilus sp. YIM 78166]|uniref:ABC transporter ATP-binding protein n=1 Tax=Ammoniphilus sp. YIM 78166 TaxID=1644106 RepID=UPI00106F1C9B|nr:ATP-binding cassette domain-containing protein [Ammoniphilus sp. YIM 78166]